MKIPVSTKRDHVKRRTAIKKFITQAEQYLTQIDEHPDITQSQLNNNPLGVINAMLTAHKNLSQIVRKIIDYHKLELGL